MMQDLRFAIRSALKSPAFTLVVVLSLALGVGANTTIFTIINAVFLRPIPVKDPERLAMVYTVTKAPGNLPVALLNYYDFRDHVQEFSGLAAYQGVGLNLTGSGEPLRVGGRLVTANYFEVLGVKPSLGRTFLADDDKLVGPPAVVISDGLWRRAFAADPAVVGRNILLNGAPCAVIGIAPAEFRGLSTFERIEVWGLIAMHTQLAGAPTHEFYDERRALGFNVFGRMKPGVTLAQAGQAMKSMARVLEKEYPADNEGKTVELVSLPEAALPGRDFVRSGALLQGATGLVLLIACGNVASLLLGRAAARRKEAAIRLSLGAPRWRLIRQLLSESMLLAVLGGGAGILTAYWGRDLLWSFRPPGTSADFLDLSLDPRVLWFTVLLSGATGLLFGLIPALQGSRADLISAIKSQAEGPAAKSRWRGLGLDVRGTLVVVQIGLSLVALIGAGLFMRSLQQAQRIDLGFQPKGLVMMFLNAGAQGYSAEKGIGFYREALERVQSLPGVQSAAWSESVPLFSGSGINRRIYPEDRELPPELRIFVPFAGTWPGYFSTIGIPVLRGREFTSEDRAGSEPVAVINETMARMFWPGQEALGKRFKIRSNPNFNRIVGIVRDAKYNGIGSEPRPYLYFPATQQFTASMTLCVRTSGDARALLGAMRREIRSLEPNMPLGDPVTMMQVIEDGFWAPRMGAMLLAIFGVLAVTLAAVGIYGVMSFSVTRRTREIGIRIALGAESRDVLRMVLRQGLKLSLLGIGLGLAVAFATTRLISNLLYGTSPTDAPTFTVISLVLLAVALAASFLPARRATRVDPLVALRYE